MKEQKGSRKGADVVDVALLADSNIRKEHETTDERTAGTVVEGDVQSKPIKRNINPDS